MDSVGTERAAAPAKFEPAEKTGRLKLFAVRALNYLTNHVVCHLPSFRLRHARYRRVLGISLGEGAAVHLDLTAADAAGDGLGPVGIA